jgi:hypothetical protein
LQGVLQGNRLFLRIREDLRKQREELTFRLSFLAVGLSKGAGNLEEPYPALFGLLLAVANISLTFVRKENSGAMLQEGRQS